MKPVGLEQTHHGFKWGFCTVHRLDSNLPGELYSKASSMFSLVRIESGDGRIDVLCTKEGIYIVDAQVNGWKARLIEAGEIVGDSEEVGK